MATLIEDGFGTALTTGVEAHRLGEVAQRLADRLGRPVYAYWDDADDGEEPTEYTPTRWRWTMTKDEAVERLRTAAEDDPDLIDEAGDLFRAIYGRAPDEDDGDEGQWISLCYAALDGGGR